MFTVSSNREIPVVERTRTGKYSQVKTLEVGESLFVPNSAAGKAGAKASLKTNAYLLRAKQKENGTPQFKFRVVDFTEDGTDGAVIERIA